MTLISLMTVVRTWWESGREEPQTHSSVRWCTRGTANPAARSLRAVSSFNRTDSDAPSIAGGTRARRRD